MKKIGSYKNRGEGAELKLAATMACIPAEDATYKDLRLITQNGNRGWEMKKGLRRSLQKKMSGGGGVERYRGEGRK